MRMKNICIMVGARPNFIKVAPLIWAIHKVQSEGKDINFNLVYAGKEDDPTLESTLFQDLQIAPPDVFLGVDCVSLNELTGCVMAQFENYLNTNPTDVVIVVDDLASTMAAAIVTKKCGIKLAHIVAGTRSFDMKMPKEINRLVIDGLSDYLFTAGAGACSIVTREGAEMSQIYMVGNILIDTLRHNRDRFIEPKLSFVSQQNAHTHTNGEVQQALHKGEYIVFTLNRRALIANKDNLSKMLTALVQSAHNIPIIAPLRGMACETILALADSLPNFYIVEPLNYLEFGWLTAHALGVVTDSGNVAEEATFNAVPCITLNSYTEHIETVNVGSNVLVGEDAQKLSQAAEEMACGKWKKSALPDRWDGRTAERIIQILA